MNITETMSDTHSLSIFQTVEQSDDRESEVLRMASHATGCRLDFLIWLLDRIRGIEEYMDEPDQLPLTEIANIAKNIKQSNHVFIDNYFFGRLSKLSCFNHRVSGYKPGCTKDWWNPIEESLRSYQAQRSHIVSWYEPIIDSTVNRIKQWLKTHYAEKTL